MEKNVEYRNDGSLAIKAGEVRLEDSNGKKVESDYEYDESVIVVPEEFIAQAFAENACGTGHTIAWQGGVVWLGGDVIGGDRPYIVGGCTHCGRGFSHEVKVK